MKKLIKMLAALAVACVGLAFTSCAEAAYTPIPDSVSGKLVAINGIAANTTDADEAKIFAEWKPLAPTASAKIDTSTGDITFKISAIDDDYHSAYYCEAKGYRITLTSGGFTVDDYVGFSYEYEVDL